MTKIAVVGPVVPFRGGIAQHTSRLVEALSKRVETHVYSFSRLYPRWLYPGRFQTDESVATPGRDVRFVLDSINPFTWHGLATSVEQLRPVAVIIPWWTFFLAPCFRYVARRLSKKGISVIFMCHNVVDHEAAQWKKWLSKWVLKHGTVYVVHSRMEERQLRVLLGNAETLYHPHPVYDHLPPAKGILSRRADLELLFYGFIRPYKGLDVLLDAMSQLKGVDAYLSIVGEPWVEGEQKWRERIRDSGLEDRVEFIPRYISDEETAEYFSRADAVILPYRSATGTGVAAIAIHYRKPVIASSIGGLSDIVEEGATGLLVPPGDSGRLASAIGRFNKRGIQDVVLNIESRLSEMSWDHMAQMVVDICLSRGPKKHSVQ